MASSLDIVREYKGRPPSEPSLPALHLNRVDSAHELDERRREALAEVDRAKFSSFHVKVCFVAGVGFFTDAYDIFAINIASTMLGYVYGSQQVLTPDQDLAIKIATPIGNLFGALLFGWLADIIGRKRMYGIELIIIVMGTLCQALAGHGPGISLIAVLIFWRFLMGIGIGGDYPLSAVIASEFAAARSRGRLMTAVFAFQGWGTFTASLVSLVVVSAFKKQIIHDDPVTLRHVDYCWRLLIGLGCIPGVVALYFRLTIPETPRFTMDIARNVEQATSDIENVLATGDYYIDPDAAVQRADAPKASRRDFLKHFRKRENCRVLFCTAYSWFANDIVFYGLGLNSSNILTTIGFGNITATNNLGVYENLRNVSVGNLILSTAGLIPGYWVSFLFIDTWGRKPIQLMGFSVLTAIFIIMGFGYDALNSSQSNKKVFVFLWCLADFFQNFGPNVTTFVIPGELFPTRYRSTAHGISAASGKLGAIVAQVVFTRLKDDGGRKGEEHFLKHILEIFALFMLSGIFSTLFLPETKEKSLEELSNEDQEGFIQGVRHTEGRNGTFVSA
ncbi:MFS general substrate transporter [Artomyces pyxidatus]|uniref:MFS general substrate transporter n=1 Tax=Artomyces pyxidatus TaxID=48021 RepID=A0ACB8SZ82_9AGAM|nr:MFS general substrate transporter [Artomyces pyxidatus]